MTREFVLTQYALRKLIRQWIRLLKINSPSPIDLYPSKWIRKESIRSTLYIFVSVFLGC